MLLDILDPDKGANIVIDEKEIPNEINEVCTKICESSNIHTAAIVEGVLYLNFI